jgi:hypothetical protein
MFRCARGTAEHHARNHAQGEMNMQNEMLKTIDDNTLEAVTGGGLGSSIGSALGGILDGATEFLGNLLGSGLGAIGGVLTGLGGILSSFGPKH